MRKILLQSVLKKVHSVFLFLALCFAATLCLAEEQTSQARYISQILENLSQMREHILLEESGRKFCQQQSADYYDKSTENLAWGAMFINDRDLTDLLGKMQTNASLMNDYCSGQVSDIVKHVPTRDEALNAESTNAELDKKATPLVEKAKEDLK